jgi:hypothetical protein
MKLVIYDLHPKIVNVGQCVGIIAGKVECECKIIYLMMAINGRNTLQNGKQYRAIQFIQELC